MTPGTATCADCPWRVATTPAAWVGELLQHRWQTHDKGRAPVPDNGIRRNREVGWGRKTAPAGNRSLTPSELTGKG